MSIQGIRAGRAFVEFLIDDKKLNSGLAKISKQLSSWGRTGLAASGSVLAGFSAAAAMFSSAGDELDKMSKRTGLSVESLSELQFAAGQSGVEMETVEKAMKELQRNGIDPLKFDDITADLAAIPDHTKRAQAAMEIFGARSGQALLPLLSDLPALRQQARDLGLVMSTQDATAAAMLNDQMSILKTQLFTMAVQVGAAIAGPLTEFLQWTQTTLAWVIQWIHENPVLVETLAAVAAAVALASAATIGFGFALSVVTAHPIVAVLSAVAGVALVVSRSFRWAAVGVLTFAAALAVMTAHPIIAVLTGIAAVIVAVGKGFGWAAANASKFAHMLSKIPGVSWLTGGDTKPEPQQPAASIRGPSLTAPTVGMPSVRQAITPQQMDAAASMSSQFSHAADGFLSRIAMATEGTFDVLRTKPFGLVAGAR